MVLWATACTLTSIDSEVLTGWLVNKLETFLLRLHRDPSDITLNNNYIEWKNQ